MKNKKINLFGSIWKIEFIDNVIDEDNNWIFGHLISDERTIKISTKDQKGKSLPKHEVNLTVLHEVMHAVLITGQYISISDDEPLVEWLARCILSLRNQNLLTL